MIKSNKAINGAVMRLLDSSSNQRTLGNINSRAARDYSKKMSKVNQSKSNLEHRLGIQSML